MKNIITYIFLVSFLLLPNQSMASSDALLPFQNLQGRLEIAGGTAHISIMKRIAKNIMMANPNIWISISGGGSAFGIEKAAKGYAGIGNSGRPLTEGEKQMYGLIDWPFAIDCVAIVVNISNNITSLTTTQVKDIYSGKIKNWKEVGGVDAPITVYARERKSGTQHTFVRLILNKEISSHNLWNILKSNGSMRTAVSLDKNAIGFLSIGFLDQRKRIKKIALNGVPPTQETTKDGSYLFSRKLYMNTKALPNDLIKAFINYIYSPEGADIITQSGYIPLEREEDKLIINN